MVPTKRAVLQLFILILLKINGLHSYPRNHPSLGMLNDLIGTDSNSPLIVVIGSNNQVKNLDDEQNRGYRQDQGHSNSCPDHPDHVHNPRHYHDNRSPKMSNQDYESTLYELLRTSQKLMERQARQGSSKPKTKGKDSCEDGKGEDGKKKDSCEDGKKKDSCENDKEQILAEQCSESGDYCGD